MPIQIVIIDDSEVVRAGLDALLRPECRVVGTAASGEEGIAVIKETQPDVVLLDVRLPSVDGMETLGLFRSKDNDTPVVMLSAHDNPTYVARSIALGANDFLLKGDSKKTYVDALNRAAAGEAPSADSVLRKVGDLMSRSPNSAPDVKLPLTRREIQVLTHVALGLSNKEIAKALSISVETVKEHVQNILRKLNAAIERMLP